MENPLKPLINKVIYSKTYAKVRKTLDDLKKRFSERIIGIALANTAIVAFQLIYLRLRFVYVNSQVPFWYTRLWGDYQLADKMWLYAIPAASLLAVVIGMLLTLPVRRYYIRYGIYLIGIFTISANLILTFSMLRIIYSASTPFDPLINPLYLDLLVPGFIAFLTIRFILPRFINFAKERDIVTSPEIHSHPGMLLSEPSARGGGFIYGIVFLILAVIFIGVPSRLAAFYLALFLISLLGMVDDYQNTHAESKLRFMENPFIRLGLLFLLVSIVSFSGIRIFSISSPFGTGTLLFDSEVLSTIFTTIWIVWLLNVLSWSNGIDGQYAGIVGIVSFLIVLLALRFDPLKVEDMRVAVLAAISVGLSLGFVKYTWHPSKILWGFGAMSAGLVLAVLSILINSKIITSIIIILIPFMDAFVTVLRRILQGKNPLKGDRGHLHHILLNRGWSIRRIALFYWATTAFFGGLGYLTAERLTIQMGFILLGLGAFIIVMLNLRLKKDIIAPEDSLEESLPKTDS